MFDFFFFRQTKSGVGVTKSPVTNHVFHPTDTTMCLVIIFNFNRTGSEITKGTAQTNVSSFIASTGRLLL
jgi:hypothetical protein